MKKVLTSPKSGSMEIRKNSRWNGGVLRSRTGGLSLSAEKTHKCRPANLSSITIYKTGKRWYTVFTEGNAEVIIPPGRHNAGPRPRFRENMPRKIQTHRTVIPRAVQLYIFRLSTPFRISNRNAMKLFMYGINSPESIIDMTSSSVAQRASMTSSA